MTMHQTTARIAAALLMSGGLAVGGLAGAPGIAHANGGPYTWCPGQSMDWPAGPNQYSNLYVWDMNACHTWYRVTWGYGNVPERFDDGTVALHGSSAWDGPNPPGDNPSGVNCGLFFCPVPPHPDPNFHP